MKKKFRVITAVVIAFTMIFVSVSCGSSIKGETFDGGNIEVFVPEGWKAYHGADPFDSYEEGYNPNEVNIGKGVENELQLFGKPMLNIVYSGKDRTLYMPTKDIYENGKDLKDITTGEYTWKAFTAESLGYPIAVLFTEVGDEQLQVSLTLENNGEKISLEDEDVLAILERIKIKE